ncbi:hypothetical protein B7494_g7309 [Chlorociboria aeruginascens]|nr:hypothetical protein B7494_g7309 [Chlorociboria aeruginascens]
MASCSDVDMDISQAQNTQNLKRSHDEMARLPVRSRPSNIHASPSHGSDIEDTGDTSNLAVTNRTSAPHCTPCRKLNFNERELIALVGEFDELSYNTITKLERNSEPQTGDPGRSIRLMNADSVHYLPLAEATIFRFLVPITTAWACSIFLGQVFTRKELAAGLIALFGVVLIVHPSFIFGDVDDRIESSKAGPVDKVLPKQRLIAIAVAILGIFGASGAYTVIRVIGSRAHALLSVNYFAVLSTVGSTVALLVIPDIGFTMPQGGREWALLLLLGVLGFALLFLLTMGLQLDKSNKATSMMYTQVLFAVLFDWAIWGVLPGGWSWIGGAIVIASTLWSALQKSEVRKVENRKDVDEETALLGEQTEETEVMDMQFRRESISAE